jgi:hypothetical protein
MLYAGSNDEARMPSQALVAARDSLLATGQAVRRSGWKEVTTPFALYGIAANQHARHLN